jgi:hypothetical protein
VSYIVKKPAPIWTRAGVNAGTLAVGTLLEISTGSIRIKDGELEVHKILLPIQYQEKYVELRFLFYVPPDETPTEPQEKPLPLLKQPAGWLVTIGDGQKPLFVKHDVVYNRGHSGLLARVVNAIARLLGAVEPFMLKYTNETVTALPYSLQTGVQLRSKVIVKLEKMRAWVYEFERHMGKRVLGLFVQPGFGFCDTDAPNTDPYRDNVHVGVIDCGGNRRNGLGTVYKNNVKYEIIQTQKFQAGPNTKISYKTHPHLMEKQVDVGDVGNGIFWRTSSVGDCIWPWVSDRPVCHHHGNITFYPALPFDAKIDGYYVRVTKYVFSGSSTFIYNSNDGELPKGWYLAEEIVVPPGRVEPYGGSDKDYVRHIQAAGWPVGCTPPIAGWRKS